MRRLFRPGASPGFSRGRFLLCLALAFACVLGSSGVDSVHAQDPQAKVWTIDALLGGFASMPGLQAEFREEKHLALLSEPLVNEGTLHFSGGKLARHVTAPVASSVLIADGVLQFGDASGTETIDLGGNPVVRLFVDSFVHIFAGDRAALDQIYSMQFSPADAGAWTLVLRPRMSPLDKVIDRVIVEGSDLAITKMRIIEIGGDETVTVFSKVDTTKKYSKRELAEVFSIR